MFFESLWRGLLIFAHIETWGVLLVLCAGEILYHYLSGTFNPQSLIRQGIQQGAHGGGPSMLRKFVFDLFTTMTVAALVLSLLSILLGGEGLTPFQWIKETIWFLMGAVIGTFFISFGIRFIPVLKKIHERVTVIPYIQGMILFHLITGLRMGIHDFPPIWSLPLYLILDSILFFVVTVVISGFVQKKKMTLSWFFAFASCFNLFSLTMVLAMYSYYLTSLHK